MANVIKSPQAGYDLKNILRYIGDQSGSPSIVATFSRELDNKLEQYSRQPQMGTIYHQFFQEIRYFTFKSQYVIFYQEIPNGIEIIRVLHGARDIDLTDLL
jgi:toxin ParE1/3/4